MGMESAPLSIPFVQCKWKKCPPLCHPDRSVPGFPATMHWTGPRVRLSVRERRMKCTNATKVNRKSGVAKWRDLQFSKPLLEMFSPGSAQVKSLISTSHPRLFEREGQ